MKPFIKYIPNINSKRITPGDQFYLPPEVIGCIHIKEEEVVQDVSPGEAQAGPQHIYKIHLFRNPGEPPIGHVIAEGVHSKFDAAIWAEKYLDMKIRSSAVGLPRDEYLNRLVNDSRFEAVCNRLLDDGFNSEEVKRAFEIFDAMKADQAK